MDSFKQRQVVTRLHLKRIPLATVLRTDYKGTDTQRPLRKL